jgi:hypothetical protein
MLKPDTRKHQGKEGADKKWRRKYRGKKEEIGDLWLSTPTKGTEMLVVVVVHIILYMAGIYSNNHKRNISYGHIQM